MALRYEPLAAALLLILAACGGEAVDTPTYSTNREIAISRVIAPAPINVGAAKDATMAVYATIVNSASTPDSLTSVQTQAARIAGLHRTMEQDGVMRMMAATALEIPAASTFRLEPGASHIMLENLTRQYVAGDSIDITLVFSRAGRVALRAQVVPYGEIERALR